MKKKKFISVLLTLAMVFTMIPAFTITSSAASPIEISDMNQLKTALEKWDNANLILTKDIDLEVEKKIGTWCTIGNTSNKVLDLNGHKIRLYNKRNDEVGGKDNIELMIKLTGAATLTIKDSSSKQNGYIFHDGHIDELARISIRNVIQVDKGATLNLESGTIKTGDYKNVFEGGVMPAQTVSKHIWGTGVIVNGGVFNMYGGRVEGSGGEKLGYIIDQAGIYSKSYNSIINIYNGTVIGYNAAPSLKGTAYGTWTVMNGKFETTGTSDSYIWGDDPKKADAAPVGVEDKMLGNWSKVVSSNKTPVLNSTKLEVKMLDIPLTIVSQTTNEDLNKMTLLRGDNVSLKVVAVGGTAPYVYDWEVKRTGDSDFGRMSLGGPEKIMSLVAMDNRAKVRCKVTDKKGATAYSNPVEINVADAITKVNDININIASPVAGETPSYTATASTPGVKVSGVEWYVEKTIRPAKGASFKTYNKMNSEDKFEAGGKYKVQIYVTESDIARYAIAPKGINEVTGLTINGKAVTSHTLNQEADRSLIYEFPLLPAPVDPGEFVPVNPGQDSYVFPFTDVKTTDWFYKWVEAAHKMGLIDGMTPTTYVPDGNMTYAQAIKLAACMNQKYTDGKVTLTNGSPNWYDSYVKYCLDKKIIDQDYASVINKNIDRKTYVHIFSKALPSKEFNGINTIPSNSLPDVKEGATYYDEIYLFYRAGIINGSDSKGTFNPDNNIKRSEVAAILIRIMDKSYRVAKPADL